MQRRHVRTENRLRLFDPSGNRLRPAAPSRAACDPPVTPADDTPAAASWGLPDTVGMPRPPQVVAPDAPADAAISAGTLFLPQGYEPAYRYPLLIWLPDSRSSRFDLGRVMAGVSFRNHVAILPAGLGRGSARASDPAPCRGPFRQADREACIWEALARARQEASIHPSRIFLVGQGDGGTEAFRLGCRHTDTFGGVISIGGGFPDGEATFSRLSSVRRLPMLLCCRQESEIARSLDRTLRLFHAAGGTLAVRLYSQSGSLTAAMLADVNRWVMEQICGTSDVSAPVAN